MIMLGRLIVAVIVPLTLLGCSKWELGWEAKDSDSPGSSDIEGYYRDHGKGISFLILRDGTLWGWDHRGSEGFFSDLDLSDDKDEPAFEGDLISFTDRDYYTVEGVIDGYYREQSDINGFIHGERRQSFDAIYDDLYEDKPSVRELSGSYRNKSSFIDVDDRGEFDGIWEDCRFDGTAKASSRGNYFTIALSSPDYDCLYSAGDEMIGIILVDDETLTAVAMDELEINGVLMTFEKD